MRIKEIQRKGDNLYTVTYEKWGLFGSKTIERDVYKGLSIYMYASTGNIASNFMYIENLVKQLNGYEPLKIK